MIIYISLFYIRSHWDVLAKSITKTMHHLEKQKLVKAFNVIFGTERGDNISLIIYTLNTKAKEKAIDYLSNYFNLFFQANPSPKNLTDAKGNNLFMNFPNNSIQFNLYKNDFVPDDEKPDLKVNFFTGLSKHFLFFLSKNKFKQWIEEPVTGLFIMQILLLKAFEVGIDEGHQLFKQLFLKVNSELSYYDTLHFDADDTKASIPEKKMKEEFKQNKTLLTTILTNLYAASLDDLILEDSLYNNYYKLCRDAYIRYMDNRSVIRTTSLKRNRNKKNWLSELIRDQIGFLGIPPVNELLAFYFLKNSYHSCLGIEQSHKLFENQTHQL